MPHRGRTSPWNEDHVRGKRHAPLRAPERLPQQPLDSRADVRLAHLAADHEAEPRELPVALPVVDAKMRREESLATLEDLPVFARGLDPLYGTQSLIHEGSILGLRVPFTILPEAPGRALYSVERVSIMGAEGEPAPMPEDLKRYIREIPDFPKPGIGFKDISPLLQNGPAFTRAVDEIAAICEREDLRPECCACPEARGFIFGAALAYRLEAGFVPIRKPGKLPAATCFVEYALEYGTDRVEIHLDSIQKGQRVLLVDDLLATGGTIAACAKLVDEMGGTVVGCAFVVELAFLNGRKLLERYPTFSLVRY